MRIPVSIAIAALVLAPAVAFAAKPAPAPSPTSAPAVPKGTQFVVQLAGEIRANGPSGQSAPTKQKMTLLNDVLVGDRVIAKAGDTVDATSDTQVAATAGHIKTTLLLDIADIVNFCGDTIPVAGHFEQGGGTNMFFFGHSKAAVFPKNSLYVVATDRLVKGTCSEKSTETPAPIPTNAATPAP